MGRASKDKFACTVDLQSQQHRTRGRRSSWSALAHLPNHLHAAIASYRRQTDQSGDLDRAIRQFLDRIIEEETPESVMAKLVAFDQRKVDMKPGTILSREWNGITQRAIVVDDGFLWEGARYDSLSAIAFAITGTRWNGPRFFGLRDSTVGGENEP